ncbi:hypothetical protein SLEP1_g7438 [Rubroshorea leprosula]|uniref:Uncharacterized protein n=1 Tax=Rubroshorea leprosula TaxID=152421 RepID=A0AAV5I9B9_9ROSI|nr:hypothetical protein SLEP1_g7438 [Rubroshorea leprosula]
MFQPSLSCPKLPLCFWLNSYCLVNEKASPIDTIVLPPR